MDFLAVNFRVLWAGKNAAPENYATTSYRGNRELREGINSVETDIGTTRSGPLVRPKPATSDRMARAKKI
jgi:hypothetical protein